MLFPPIDPNERFRERRAAIRRRKRLRRSAAVGAFLVVLAVLGVGARFVGTDDGSRSVADLATLAATPSDGPKTLPIELRGVHVTMALASLPGKLDEYLDLERDGLTAVELDVKDENGEIGFVPSSVPLAASSGAARDYYAASRRGAARARARRLPHRAHRDVRGPGSRARAPGSRDPPFATARSGAMRRVSAGRIPTTGACGSTTSTSRSRRRVPDSTRSCSTTSGSPPTGTSAALSTAGRARSRSARRFRRSSGTRASASHRTTSGSPRPSSACRRRATSGSASSRSAWRRTSTRCTR